MKSNRTLFLATMVMVIAFMSTNIFAGDYTHSTPGINGYDPVAYFTDGKPKKGNGYHVADYEGVIYVFANKKNRKMFEANPGKYIPAYGGYCAYGVAVGKKFVADPEVWRIENGKLYLNLDNDIQKKWLKDIPGYIKKADSNWMIIKNKTPFEL